MQYFSFASSKLFLFFLLITFNQILFATPLSNSFHVFENYSIEDGLPDYTVNTIFQDSYGYLWIGTANGLCRYDGYTIEEINICKDFGISKVRNIYCFHEDENNDVLIGTDNGLFKFRRVNESIELIAGPDTTSNLLPISNFAIKKILSDSQNNLWIGTYNGLYKVDKNEKVKTFLFSEVAPVYVTDLLFNDETELFFSTNIGLMRMNIETETIDHFPHFHENEINVPSQKYATSLQAGLDGKLFVGTWGMGLYVFDMNKEEYVRSYVENPEADNHISSNVIFSLNSDNEGNIWIGTENSGLNKLNINTNVFTAFKHSEYQSKSLPGNTIKCISVDNHGDLWLGFYMGGLSKLDFDKMKFNHYRHYFSIVNSPSNNKISSFLEVSSNDIWIGTDGGGINRFDPETGKFRHIRAKDKEAGRLTSDVIMSLDYIDDQIWAGTYNSGINVLNKNGELIKSFKMDIEDTLSLSGNNISIVYKDSKEHVWVGVTYDIPCYYTGNGRFLRIKYPENSNLPLRSVRDIHEDQDGNIWFGGSESLVKFDSISGGHFYFSKYDLFSKANGLINPVITCLAEDISGNLLIGTQGYGFAIYNLQSGKVKKLTKDDGLPSNDIAGITIARNGEVWISTSNGLVCMNTKDVFSEADALRMHSYDVKDGLQGNTFNTGAIVCTRSGMIFAGGNNGFNTFNPDLLVKNEQLSPVYITDIEVNHQSIPVNSEILQNKCIHATDAIELKHNQSTISFLFTGVDFKLSDKIQYRYRLKGFEENWNQTGIEKKATYTNLSPGNYELNIQAANSSGVWNRQGTSLSLKILPPWWQTWWAGLLYIVIVTVSVLLFRLFLILRERKRNQLEFQKMEISKEKELNKMKLNFFTNISHELRTPLSLISGPIEQLLIETNYKEEQKIQLNLIKRNTKRLVQLVDQLMEFRKLKTQTLPFKPSHEDLVYHLKTVFDDFNLLAENKKIDYNFHSNVDEFFIPFDVDKMHKIISNLISNAFKFTKSNGKITLNLEVDKTSERYHIKISDNGIGIDKQHLEKIFDPFYQAHEDYYNDMKGTGIGLTFCKALVEMHGGVINVESNKDITGDKKSYTVFTITIPVKEELCDSISFYSEQEASENKHDHLDHNLLKELSPHDTPKPKILLVEDNMDVKSFIQLNLSNFYEFLTADNGLEGIEKAKQNLPDLIVSDVIMPLMDGVKMCYNLKHIPETSHIPVIMLTAKTSDESILEGLKTGIDTYITKPFNINVLASYINNILKNRNELHEKYRTNYLIDDFKICSTKTDESFIDRIYHALKKNMSDTAFGVDELSRESGMSRTNFYKKMKSLTGLTVNEFIKNYKMKVAARLLLESDMNINEIIYEIGVKDASYFSRCFKQTFGYLPTEFRKNRVDSENITSTK